MPPPIYDYQCRNCDHEFEEIHMIVDRKKPTRRKCPECGRKMVKQLLGKHPISMVDSVNIGRTKPDGGYSEVIARINEGQNIKGTKYELQDRLSRRVDTLKKGV